MMNEGLRGSRRQCRAQQSEEHLVWMHSTATVTLKDCKSNTVQTVPPTLFPRTCQSLVSLQFYSWLGYAVGCT
eukprot:1041-Eustigmatos_ZCMA.PRE.1